MRIIEIDYCNNCPYFETDVKERKVNDDYEGNYFTINDDRKTKHIEELICYCLEKEAGYMTPIKNLGVEVFDLDNELSIKMEKQIEDDYDLYLEASNKLFDDYRKKLKVKIPKWCPLKK